jgi:hypothetical protein
MQDPRVPWLPLRQATPETMANQDTTKTQPMNIKKIKAMQHGQSVSVDQLEADTKNFVPFVKGVFTT